MQQFYDNVIPHTSYSAGHLYPNEQECQPKLKPVNSEINQPKSIDQNSHNFFKLLG